MGKIREWLLKSGTKEVYVRTPLLAKRSDMVPVSPEQAAKLCAEITQEQVNHTEEVKKEIDAKATEIAKVVGDGLDQMDETQLRAKANEIKIFIGPNWKADTIKAKIRETLKADAEVQAAKLAGMETKPE